MSASAFPARARHLLALLGLVALLAVTGCTLPASDIERETAIDGPPLVSIAAPRPNASYLEDVPVNIQASIANAGADIDRVEVSVNGEVIASQPQPNANGAPVFSITQVWPAASVGSYTIGVTAFRADGTASDTASVSINVISPAPTDIPAEDDATDEPTDEQPPADPPTPVPTDPPPPTEIPATATPDRTTALFTTGINVRSGPGTNFNPPIGQFAANSTAEVLSVNLDGSWLKVRFGSGEGWVYRPLVEVQGSLDGLPREAGPPTPVPPPPTAVPPPPVQPPPQDPAQPPPAASQANLTGAQPSIQPNPPVCGQQFTVLVNFVNNGSEPTNGPATVRFENVHVASGSVEQSFERQLPVMQPGQDHVEGGPFNITTYVNEEHEIRVTIDPNNQVPESNTADNRLTARYTLQPGC